MGTARSPFKQQAIQMRLQGKSYNDIRKALNLPSKGTLSYWFKNLELTVEAKMLLQKNIDIATKRKLFDANLKRSARIKAENKMEFDAGSARIGNLNTRELMLVGAALYWGEGTKSDNKGKWQSLSFANSDPMMVKVYLKFVRKVFNVPNIKIRGGIHLYPNTNIDGARNYWATVTKLPPDRFYITTMVSRLSAGKRDPRLLPHGTIALRVHDRKLFHHMKGMIQGLFEAKIRS